MYPAPNPLLCISLSWKCNLSPLMSWLQNPLDFLHTSCLGPSISESSNPRFNTGFGSLIVDDRERVTQKILDAFIETGQRLLLSKGWANLGEGFNLPDTVMLLVDTPHDWLLPKCSAVVHHGGAGTTAAGALPLLRSLCSFLCNLRSCHTIKDCFVSSALFPTCLHTLPTLCVLSCDSQVSSHWVWGALLDRELACCRDR